MTGTTHREGRAARDTTPRTSLEAMLADLWARHPDRLGRRVSVWQWGGTTADDGWLDAPLVAAARTERWWGWWIGPPSAPTSGPSSRSVPRS